jgi:hypothetical protein
MGGAPRMPPQPAPPPQPPNLLDPTVMFKRQRERQKAQQAMGRNSTILTKPLGSSYLAASRPLGG